MGKRIANSFIERLKDQADLVEVINRRVPLKKAGANYQACCPFHNEKTPSFSVAPNKGFYYCFGCGAKGSAINFLMEYEHLSFVDAVEKLAEESNLTVEYEQFDEVKAQRRKDLYDLLDETATLYETQLFNASGDSARNYLNERQLDTETAKFFRLGFSLSGSHLQQHFAKEFDANALEKAGLLVDGDNGKYDRFRERLMFPIRDPRGRVLGFGARALGDAMPKYLNSSETEVFSKRYVLYGLYEELQTNRNIEHLIVVEGYMDVIALHQKGVRGAVAALGTAFTPEHLNLVRRHTNKIFICFDGDNAGKKAAKRAMETILPAMTLDMDIRVVFLPDGEDPDTLVRQIGREAFVQKMQEGQRFSEFVYEALIADSNLEFVEGRGEVAARAKTLFDNLPDSEYKGILYQGLTERIGMDVYQLAQTVHANQPFERKAFERKPRLPRNPRGGSIEARLIRRLVELPHLVRYAQHTTLLQPFSVGDSALLLHIIWLLQARGYERGNCQQKLLQSLPEDDAKRLQQIIEQEKLVEKTHNEDSLEILHERYTEEFISGLETVLYGIQRKYHFADLKSQ